MKILFINSIYRGGSTGDICYNIALDLKKNGHEATIAYGRGKRIIDDIAYKFSYNIEVYLNAFIARVVGFNGYFAFFSTRRLIKYIEKYNPDVIHIHEVHAYFLNYFKLINYIKLKKIKTVWTFHCEYVYTGKCGHAYECDKFKTNCNHCPHLHDYPKSLFFDFTHKMFNDKKKILYDFNFIIITPSQWLLDRVKQSFLSSKKIIVIHNGVDTNIFKIKRNNSLIENLQIINKKIVLTAAPDILSDSKGGQYVVNIAKRKMNENIIFIILGVKGIKDIQKKGNIIYSPLINNKVELSNYYNIADLFVICSKKETFSMTCAESLSCGTRVVGYKSGAPETIFNNKYASFVEYGNENLLNELINQKININYDRETIRKYAMDHFSLIQMTKQYDKIYGIGEQKEFG